jgi:hypothetical protein
MPDAPRLVPAVVAGTEPDSIMNLRSRSLVASVAARVLFVLGGILAWSGVPGSAEIVRVRGERLQLGVDRESGRILELIDGVSGRNFAGDAAEAAGWWSLELAGNPGVAVASTNARSFRVEVLPAGERRAGGLRLSWAGFGVPDAPGLRVEVIAEVEAREGVSWWRIAAEGLGNRTVERLRFPRLLGLPRLERERLAMPFWAGLLARDPRSALAGGGGTGTRREFDYPGHASLQCLAFYSEGGPGLSMQCDDEAGYRKLFAAFGGSGQALHLEIVHLAERGPGDGGRYALPYAVGLRVFEGDWYGAAAAYRGWATNRVWARESRWRGGKVPRWIADTGLWIWNRGRSPGVLEPAIALQREAGLPVSVFWHWWHGCAYDTGFPEYLPPREGDDAFAAALERAHAHDVRALVYMNQRLWGMTTASWTNENAARFAVKAPDGTVRPEVYNTFTRLPCATMCLATEFWRGKYAGLAAEAFNRLGVDGIYMDQACSSLACYDPAHGHPPGGGTYWMNGFRALAADLRRRCPDRGGPALAGEGCAENWLPYLDLFLALDFSRERFAAPDGWDPIPFFHAVYHGYAVFYGNYSSLTMPPYDDLWPAATAPAKPLQLLDARFRRQFLLEQARSFTWGQQLTLANFRPEHLRERPEEIAYLLRLAHLRRAALRYLQDGTLLPPPPIEVATEEIPMSRLSIYAGQQGALREFRKTVCPVLASVWRAPDGGVAVALASISDQALEPTLILDSARYGLSPGARAFPVGPTGGEPLGERRGAAIVLRPRLAPRDARVWELH